MADYSTEQNLELAQQLLKRQGEINALRNELAVARRARTAVEAERDTFEATIARVRLAVYIADTEDVTDWQRGYRAAANRVLAALDPCQHCGGVVVEPGTEEFDYDAHMYNPSTAAPCSVCNGTGKAAALATPETVQSDSTDQQRTQHIGGRANAEHCPACSGTNPPYPFICPGEPETPRDTDA